MLLVLLSLPQFGKRLLIFKQFSQYLPVTLGLQIQTFWFRLHPMKALPSVLQPQVSQFSSVHSLSSSPTPSHGSPPNFGNSATALVLVWVPVPQSFEHFDQGDHCPHLQSAEERLCM